jgi:hypothetical protein
MTSGTTLTKAGNMRKIWLLALALMIGLGGSAAFALDPMGPPTAGLQHGQFKAGVDYSHSIMDLELSNGTWIEYFDGVFWDEGEAVPFTLKNFRTNRAYASLGYGAAENCEAFLRVGGTNARFGDSIWEDGERYDSSTDFAISSGIKATFFEDGNLKLGGLFQASWAQYDGILDASHLPAPDFVTINLAEIQIAVGATYTLTDHVSIYGGPFLHYVNGDLDDVFSREDGGGLLTSEYYWEVNEGSVFGGYIGARVELAEDCSLNIEYQHTAAADAVGASLMWRF